MVRGVPNRGFRYRTVDIPVRAPRVRDYRTEEARRNERARAAGFTSRAQMRAHRVSGIESVARDWSAQHSRKWISKFDPSQRMAGVSRESYIRAYYNVYVRAGTGWRKPRDPDGDDAPDHYVKHWYVTIMGIFTSSEWDARYGAPGGKDPMSVAMNAA